MLFAMQAELQLVSGLPKQLVAQLAGAWPMPGARIIWSAELVHEPAVEPSAEASPPAPAPASEMGGFEAVPASPFDSAGKHAAAQLPVVAQLYKGKSNGTAGSSTAGSSDWHGAEQAR